MEYINLYVYSNFFSGNVLHDGAFVALSLGILDYCVGENDNYEDRLYISSKVGASDFVFRKFTHLDICQDEQPSISIDSYYDDQPDYPEKLEMLTIIRDKKLDMNKVYVLEIGSDEIDLQKFYNAALRVLELNKVSVFDVGNLNIPRIGD